MVGCAVTTHGQLIGHAAADLARLSDFRGTAGGTVTPATLFGGGVSGDLSGPSLSQFSWLPVPYGPMTMVQRYPIVPRTDHLTTFAMWLDVQQDRFTAPQPTASASLLPHIRPRPKERVACVLPALSCRSRSARTPAHHPGGPPARRPRTHPRSGALLRRIPAGSGADALAVDERHARLFVANSIAARSGCSTRVTVRSCAR